MATRKTAIARRKEFELAILRIEHGRARTKPAGLSIQAVAAEVGVTAPLIHNHYPDVAELINRKSARKPARLERNESALEAERRKNDELKRELADCRDRLTKLTTINEVLIAERDELKAKLHSKNIVDMPSKKRPPLKE
ncbi:TetR family transcriptional regulator [Paraburkholderia sp. SIMBA_055]|uniref:TetR family transcriptional regulator n=1 Tax=unclassified Paraburkholderia TaxID=2615204 RepID=UPI000D301B16|nr:MULTISPECIES: TetR family transcriptional regulator [unclassified Paraburkholderia]PTQ96481.1 TetR family transcriptional regulator [Paraburkholderia sp. GV072]PUB00783.1 TetR family transcriptional regulator [Paraburkholderia sp. GV068]